MEGDGDYSIHSHRPVAAALPRVFVVPTFGADLIGGKDSFQASELPETPSCARYRLGLQKTFRAAGSVYTTYLYFELLKVAFSRPI